MFQQGKRIQNLNNDHQGTHLLLDNSLLQLQRQKLDTDGHIRILNSRVDRRRQDVVALEARLDDLEVLSRCGIILSTIWCSTPYLKGMVG